MPEQPAATTPRRPASQTTTTLTLPRWPGGAPAGDEPGSGLADKALAELDPHALYGLVVDSYLAGMISLGRPAELLRIPWLDLHSRFIRLTC